jgi:hypothetical protein
MVSQCVRVSAAQVRASSLREKGFVEIESQRIVARIGKV